MVKTNIDDLLDAVLQALIAEAIDRDWQHKYAKFANRGRKSQSLYVHAVNAFSVVRIIGSKLFDLPANDRLVASVAGFLHDYQKAYPEWQDMVLRFINGVSERDDDFSHDDGSPESLQILEELLGSAQRRMKVLPAPDFLTRNSSRILNIVVYTHDSENQSVSLRRRSEVGAIDYLARVVRLGDSIASKKDIEEIASLNHDPDVPSNKRVVFDYHKISGIRGILSSFLNEALNKLMEEAGYTPILYFGNGTAYLLVGEKREVRAPRDRLYELIDLEVEEFQKSDVYSEGLIKAAIGNYTQTKWPCIQAVRSIDIRNLFEHISGLPGANRKGSDGEAIYKKISQKSNVKKIADAFLLKSGESSMEIFSAMLSDFYVFAYFADFIKNYYEFAKTDENFGAFKTDLDTWISQVVGLSGYDELSQISHTTKDDLKIQSISQIWNLEHDSLHKLPNRREIILARFIEIIEKMLNKYRHLCPPFVQPQVKDILLADIYAAPVNLIHDIDFRKTSRMTSDTYEEGKHAKTRICNLCGTRSFQTAIAGLTGDGSEKFTNFLPAGISISGNKKAVLCQACVAEATIRSFFFGTAPAQSIIVLPDLAMSPEMNLNWAQQLQYLLIMERVGLNIGRSWNMQDVYQRILAGSIGDATKLVHYFLRASNPKVKDLTKFLKEERDDPHKIRFKEILAKPPSITHESLAEYHLTGKIEIDNRLMGRYDTPTRNQYSCYFTPSHLFLFQQSPLKEGSDRESDSSSSIRLLLMSLIMAEIYSGRVLIQDGFHPIADLSVDGLVRMKLPAPASVALAKIGIDDIIRLHESKQVLQKLSALVLVSQRYVEKLGKDRLLRIVSMNRGAILRRAQMESGQASIGTLVRYLEHLPSLLEKN